MEISTEHIRKTLDTVYTTESRRILATPACRNAALRRAGTLIRLLAKN